MNSCDRFRGMLGSIALLFTFLLALFSSRALASGNDLDFDGALKAARIVVTAKVVKEWAPKAKPNHPRGKVGNEGRVYEVTVEKVYKGKAMQTMIVLDPYYLSSASFFLSNEERNLLFLAPARLTSFQKRYIDYGAKQFFIPVRNVSEKDAQEWSGWLTLLDLLVKNRPANLHDAFRKRLPTETNRYVLRYLLEHWPKRMTKEDVALFRVIIDTFMSDPYVTSPALKRLHAAGLTLKEKDVVTRLQKGAAWQRGDLLKLINPQNILVCRDILFSWVTKPGPKGNNQSYSRYKVIDVLARFAPAYLEAKLKAENLPFWLLIPGLKSLGINGSAVGKKDVPQELLSVQSWYIRYAGDLFRGYTSAAEFGMEHPDSVLHKKWPTVFGLLTPILAGEDGPVRKLTVAMMRTYGSIVRRKGKGYVFETPEKPSLPPVSIRISVEGGRLRLRKPMELILTEVSREEGSWFCYDGSLSSVVADAKCTRTSGFGPIPDWKNEDYGKSRYVRLQKEHCTRTVLSLNRIIEKPGRYRIILTKTYWHDGGHAELDAWTGAVFSNTIEVVVK